MLHSDRSLHGNFGPLISTELGLMLPAAWIVELALAVDVPLLRQRFTYRDGDRDRALFDPAPVAVSSALSVGTIF